MDDWLLGLESFSLSGQQLGAQNRERASERARLPALPSSRNKPTTQKRIQKRQARKTRAGDFGVLEDLRKSASSLSECVFGKTPHFFLFFSHTFQTPGRLHQRFSTCLYTGFFMERKWLKFAKFWRENFQIARFLWSVPVGSQEIRRILISFLLSCLYIYIAKSG
jgi:hypothetical protein